jgi:hypothetical protein
MKLPEATRLELILQPTLLRQAAKAVARRVVGDDYTTHSFCYTYMQLSGDRLFGKRLNEAALLTNFKRVTHGLQPDEILAALEVLVYMAPMGTKTSPWRLELLEFIKTLPTETRWQGETNPEKELTIYRAVMVDSQESAVNRILRPLWAVERRRAIRCLHIWWSVHTQGKPVLAVAKVAFKHIYTLLNPTQKESNLEVLLDLNGLKNLEISDVPLEELEAVTKALEEDKTHD